MSSPNPLPREIAPGVYWLGQCLVRKIGDQAVHAVQAVFAVAGEHHTALIESGITSDSRVIIDQLESLQAKIPEPRYLFPTHSEMGHSGGVGALLNRYPELTVHGDVSD